MATDDRIGVAGRPNSGLTRWVRVLCLGGASLLLAAGAHVIGGGRLPSAGLLAMTAFLLGLAAATLTVRRCRFGVLAAVLTVQQVLLHVLFGAASAVGAGCGLMAQSGMGHLHPMPVQVCSPDMAAMSVPGWNMWLSHLSATVLTAWLLARGEAWLWRVADRIVAAAAAGPAAAPDRLPASPIGHPDKALGQLRYPAAAPRAPPPVLRVP